MAANPNKGGPGSDHECSAILVPETGFRVVDERGEEWVVQAVT